MSIVILYILGPVVVLAYKLMEHFGFWNFISGRKFALSGLERLKTTTGYPKSWLYNKDNDRKEFKAIYKRIKKRTEEEKIKQVLKDGNKPSLLTTGGNPFVLAGVPDEWEQKNKTYYSPNHPIIMIFGVEKNGQSKGKGERCCSIGDLEKWITDEKKRWDFWIGILVLSLFSIASVVWRLQVLGKI